VPLKGHRRKKALKELSGVTSIAYTEGDPVALAKAVSKYAKDNPEFTYKAGVVEGRVISIKEIQALATMPSKEELYSKLLFLVNAPAQRLVTVMNAVGKDLAVVITKEWRNRSLRTMLRRGRRRRLKIKDIVKHNVAGFSFYRAGYVF